MLHPRLECPSNQDNRGKYNNGASFGSETPAERRMEQINEMFRERLPLSHPVMVAPQVDNHKTSSLRTMGRGKISSWLENDMWMLQKVTSTLLGNLVLMNEIGVGSRSIRHTTNMSNQ
eukprot:scaffold223539_cov23-Cyclotella_meneghiniana.AAC.1